MQTRKPISIPVVSANAEEEAMAASNCDGKEMVALMVLGDSMVPEFSEGEILVIELKRPPNDGSFVIAEVAKDDFIFRQLKRDDKGGWWLHALNHVYSDTPLSSLDCIKGVVTHKRNARSRKTVKFYEGEATQ